MALAGIDGLTGHGKLIRHISIKKEYSRGSMPCCLFGFLYQCIKKKKMGVGVWRAVYCPVTFPCEQLSPLASYRAQHSV